MKNNPVILKRPAGPVAGLASLPAWLAFLAPLALWNGCFTETGNPDEEEMTAILRVATSLEDSAGASAPDSARIERLALRLTGADEYHGGKHARTLWGQGNRRAAFAEGDTLPPAPMASPRGPDSVVVRLRPYAEAPALAADTLRWESFTGDGHVKGIYHRGGVARRFLFALPDSARFALAYDRAALESWVSEGRYACRFVFRPRAWLSQGGLDTARAYAVAGGDSVVLFDAAHNSALHAALLKRFGRAFNDSKGYGATGKSAQ